MVLLFWAVFFFYEIRVGPSEYFSKQIMVGFELKVICSSRCF